MTDGARLRTILRSPTTGGSPLTVGITVTSLDASDGYGDWHTGHELGDALAELGWRIAYLARARDHWYRPVPALDLVVVLLDAFDVGRLPPHVLRIAWVRNWVDRWIARPWFSQYDIVLASSAATKRRIDNAGSLETTIFPIASNPARFADASLEPAAAGIDVVFTGNRWGVPRDAEEGLARLAADGMTVGIFGRGWEAVPRLADLAHGQRPYDELPAIYRAARIVVDDSAGPTITYGSVNSRVFDALAAGTIVITNNELGVRELFDAEFPVWRDADDLATRVHALLADEQRRQRLAARYQRVVLEEHTYARRALRLLQLVDEWVPGGWRASAEVSSPSPPPVATSRATTGRRPRRATRRLRGVAIAGGVGAGVGAAAALVTAAGGALGWTTVDAALPVGVAVGAAVASTIAVDARARGRTTRELQAIVTSMLTSGEARADLASVDAGVAALRRELPAIAGLAPLGGGYPLPIADASEMAPDAIAVLARLAADLRPGITLQLGGGVSTLVLGLTARRLGVGRIVTFDHEAARADETRIRAEALGLRDVVDVIHAPLRRQAVAGESRVWYDLPSGSLPDEQVDLLVVGGPPASADPSGFARWPAMPALEDRLSGDARVFVDDLDRDGQRATLWRWLGEMTGWSLVPSGDDRGTAVLRREEPARDPAAQRAEPTAGLANR